MTTDLRVCLATVDFLEREVSSDIGMSSGGAGAVVAWRVIISIVAALVGKQTREHSAEQGAECGTARGDDGQVDLDTTVCVSECVSRVVVGIDVVEFLVEFVDTDNSNNGDTVFIKLAQYHGLRVGTTYTPPMRNTTSKPTLAARRIRRPRKTQKGITRTRTSVQMVTMADDM